MNGSAEFAPTRPALQDEDGQLLQLAFRNVVSMVAVNTAAAALAAVSLGLDNPLICAWLIVQGVLSAIRLGVWAAFRKANPPDRPVTGQRGWAALYAAGLWFSGGLWSFLTIELIVTDPASGSLGTFTAIVIVSALAGGASGITAPVRRAGVVYISLLLLPPAVALIVSSQLTIVLGILGLGFWVVMLVSLETNHRMLRQRLTLEANNLRLIGALEAANEGLEAKVAERTARLKLLAHRDTMTGLLNRHGLLDWWSACRRDDPGLQAFVFFLDLDRFKQINDALGHDIGDRVLTAITRQIQTVVPETAALARWGGDEFVLVCPGDTTDVARVERISQTVLDAVAEPFTLNGESIRLGVSIGWARYPDDDKSFTDVIHAADLAVTEIKRSERGRVLAYSETYAEALRRRFDLSRALAQAIGTPAISLVYQPIVDARTGAVVTREALARWDHPELGSIRPDEFIKLAEDSDRIIALGDFVLTQACTDAARWRRDGQPVRVAVNVSIKQLITAAFPLKLVQILEQTGLPPSLLELEVTESVFDDEHIDRMAVLVGMLQGLGVNVHIDDFGTGYSSLSRLSRLPVSAVKIDRAFVADIDGQSRVIIESAVMIARRFGFRVVAEGVETERQAAQLLALGVDLFQGYLLGRPEAVCTCDRVEPVWVEAA